MGGREGGRGEACMARRPKETQTKTEGGNVLFLNKSGERRSCGWREKAEMWMGRRGDKDGQTRDKK